MLTSPNVRPTNVRRLRTDAAVYSGPSLDNKRLARLLLSSVRGASEVEPQAAGRDIHTRARLKAVHSIRLLEPPNFTNSMQRGTTRTVRMFLTAARLRTTGNVLCGEATDREEMVSHPVRGALEERRVKALNWSSRSAAAAAAAAAAME